MINTDQGLRRLGNPRYSIRQLLALSGSAYIPFDLSKFSFDAARAGVVPSLGDCASDSRRSSATRPRDSSSENANMTEDNIQITRVGSLMPDRRPQPPPASTLTQQNTGFARFLRKHSSPTHQRVTAGGRIVPMESAGAPPAFGLTNNVQLRPNRDFGVAEKLSTSAIKTMFTNSDVTKHTSSTQSPNAVPLDQREDAGNEKPFSAHEGWRTQVPSTMFTVPTQATHMMNINSTSAGAYMSAAPSTFTSSNPANFGLWSPVWPPLWSAPNVTSPSVGPPWPYGDGMMTTGPPPYVSPPGCLTQPIIWAQNAFMEWSQRYNELDEQLKALDRHRAMTSLTSDIAGQRREIVQQRSDSKNMMNLITSWLDLSEQIQPGTDPSSLPSPFNVDAPAYIPRTQTTYTAKPGPLLSGQTEGLKGSGDIQKPPPRSARRPIAIVPPPKLQIDTPPSDQQESPLTDSPARGVDPWGVQMGLAPPELRRQQSEILESISEAQSQSSQSNRSQESLQSVPQGGFFRVGHNIARSEILDRESPRSHREEDVAKSNFETIPSKIGAIYKEGLDALRQSKGTFTTISMPDGTHVNIEGQELQRPELASMSHFEQEYWSCKPTPPSTATPFKSGGETVLTRNVNTTPTSQIISMGKQGLSGSGRASARFAKENIAISPIVQRKAATDAFLARFNESDSQETEFPSPLYASQRRESPPLNSQRFSIPSEFDAAKHGRSGAFKHTNNVVAPQRERANSRRYVIGSDTGLGQLAGIDRGLASRSGNMSIDMFNNKGYSSTSVQSVHATAPAPQNLDGTSENKKGSRLIFSLAGKVISPRLLRRTTGAGGA